MAENSLNNVAKLTLNYEVILQKRTKSFPEGNLIISKLIGKTISLWARLKAAGL